LVTPDESTAHLDGATLDAYAVAALASENYVERFPDVAAHLDGCVRCSTLYEVTYDMLVAEEQPPGTAVRERKLDTIRTAINLRFAEERVAATRQIQGVLKLVLTRRWLDVLPEPSSGIAARRDDARYTLFELRLDGLEPPIANCAVQAITEVDAMDDRCELRIEVTLQGRLWPFATPCLVHIRYGEREQRARTDPFGVVVFRDIPRALLEGLQIEVEPERDNSTSW
jgi:hypothetical protein